VIRFEQVSKRYHAGFEALTRVNFDIDKGEMVFLTGHSGAGKSTLMKLIMLMEQPSQGQIWVESNSLLSSQHWSCVSKSSAFV
jgi:cell division transport system ATP-binding protein